MHIISCAKAAHDRDLHSLRSAVLLYHKYFKLQCTSEKSEIFRTDGHSPYHMRTKQQSVCEQPFFVLPSCGTAHCLRTLYHLLLKKIAFFDIDGTLTSEIDGSLPESVIHAIRRARTFGHLMFINTGRCFQNVEPRFRRIGFDGYVCGCGTNIFCSGTEALHVAQTHSITMQLLEAARKTNVDILSNPEKK